MDWKAYFLAGAKWAAKRGDCVRSKVGAIVVNQDTHRVVGSGYNGVAPGQAGCLSGACARCLASYDDIPSGSGYQNCIEIHAEVNALNWTIEELGWRYTYENNVDVYVTRAPCEGCAAYCFGKYVRRIVWPDGELYAEG